MQTRIRTALVLLAIAGLAGVWLTIAPFVAPGIDSYQPVGAAWTTATVHHVAIGAVLVAVSVVTGLTLIATTLRALDEMASGAPAQHEGSTQQR